MPKRLPVTLESTNSFKVDVYLVETSEYAVARNTDGEVGVTWNPNSDCPNGFPHTYQYQQWFILPEALADMVLAGASLLTVNSMAASPAPPLGWPGAVQNPCEIAASSNPATLPEPDGTAPTRLPLVNNSPLTQG